MEGSYQCVCKAPYFKKHNAMSDKCEPTEANKCAHSPKLCDGIPHSKCKNNADTKEGYDCVCQGKHMFDFHLGTCTCF